MKEGGPKAGRKEREDRTSQTGRVLGIAGFHSLFAFPLTTVFGL
jgi:hypothetical protein